MMASERPATSPPVDAPAAPPTEPVPTPPRPTTGTLSASPFLAGFDRLLALGVMVLGFAIASFAAKNSDLWLHLGAGRLIASGKYEFGKDPFSYTTAGQTWVNHSWLFDLAAYQLYTKGGGRVVVIFKAALVALLVGVLLFIRRPEQPLWLGVLGVGLGLLASAPYFVLGPIVVSCLLLGVTLLLLFRWSAATGWRLPVAMGVVCAIWSNCDAWFILGPASVGLFLLGEASRRRVRPGEENQEPNLKTLALTLAAAVVGCMVNPHHVRVWELPGGLLSGAAGVLSSDPYFAPMFRSSLEKGGLDFTGNQGGNPVNALGFLLLVGFNVAGFVCNPRRLPSGWLLVNIGMLFLAIIHQKAIPFYAVAAAACSALHWGFVAEKLGRATLAIGTVQMLAGLRVGARLLLFVGGLAALTACWPGWLHPFDEQRRLRWEVAIDPAWQRACETMQEWRASGKLPPEAHIFIVHPDLANYCAWFAPDERTFFDTRLPLHAGNAEAFLKLRQGLLPRRLGEGRPIDPELEKLMTQHGIVGTAVSELNHFDTAQTLYLMLFTRYRDRQTLEPAWDLWDIAGRTFFVGWSRQAVLPKAAYNLLAFNPDARAFGSEHDPLPDPESTPVLPRRELADRFLNPVPEPTAAGDESLLIGAYQQYAVDRRNNFRRSRVNALEAVLGVNTYGYIETLAERLTPPPSGMRGAALLAIRLARRAIADHPQRPEGYLALAKAYSSPEWIGLPPSTLARVKVASLERFMLRLPPDQLAAPTGTNLSAALELYQVHLDSGRIELATEYLRRCVQGLRVSPQMPNLPQNARAAAEQELKERERALKERENLWLTNTSTQTQTQRGIQAIRYGLHRKAYQELQAVDLANAKLPPGAQIEILIVRLELSLLLGLLEEADPLIDSIEARLAQYGNQPGGAELTSRFRQIQIDVLLVQGRLNEIARRLSAEGASLDNAIESRLRSDQFRNMLEYWIFYQLTSTPGPILLNARSLNLEGPLAGPASFMDLLAAEQIGPAMPAVADLRARVREREQIHFRLGLTYLEMDDNPNARKQFQQVVRTATRTLRTDTQALAQSYLDLFEKK